MIKFSIASKKLGVGKRKGQTVYYAKAKARTRLSIRMLGERISRATTLSRADVYAVIIALTEEIKHELMLGHTIELGELGSLKVSANGRMMNDPKDVSAATVGTPRVRFYPTMELRRAAGSVSLSVPHQDEEKKAAPPAKKTEGGQEDTSEGKVIF